MAFRPDALLAVRALKPRRKWVPMLLGKRYRDVRWATERSCARASVNNIGTALESLHEAAECSVEHGIHQQRQSPACKLIVQMEPDVAAAVRSRLKCPSGSQLAQRSIRRLDENASVGAIERNTACEGFTINPARDRHVGHQELGLSARFTGQNRMSDAERHEFMIAFDVGHEIEHLICPVTDAPHLPKNRHFSLRRGILPHDSRKWPNGEISYRKATQQH